MLSKRVLAAHRVAGFCVFVLACPISTGLNDVNVPAFHAYAPGGATADTNGPMFFQNKYHLFAQWRPQLAAPAPLSAGSRGYSQMSWYHWVSDDLLTWEPCGLALRPQRGMGAWSGSANILHNKSTGQEIPVLMHSVSGLKYVRFAIPANLSDPKLERWVEGYAHTGFPDIIAPDVYHGKVFADPSTAWQGSDGIWRLITACGGGLNICQMKSVDFKRWKYVGSFHREPESNRSYWECPDFFQIPGSNSWVIATLTRYAVASYNENSNLSLPDSIHVKKHDIVWKYKDLLYDYGAFLAAKSFYDSSRKRQLLFGEVPIVCHGSRWENAQSLPRVISLDELDSSRILTYPIEEIDTMHVQTQHLQHIKIPTNTSHMLSSGDMLDIAINISARGAHKRNISFHVLASQDGLRSQQIVLGIPPNNNLDAFNATLDDVPFLVAQGEQWITLRMIVDHSIVETFVQKGRLAITRARCRRAADEVGFYMFNSGDDDLVVDEVRVSNLASRERNALQSLKFV